MNLLNGAFDLDYKQKHEEGSKRGRICESE